MKIVTFSHQKGGVGKSTLSINVAVALYIKGFNVAILDFDKQNSAYKILSNIDSIKVYRDADQIEGGYDFLIVDTPPYIDVSLTDLYQQSDLIIVPFKVSPLDIIHAEDTINMIKKVQNKDRAISSRLVINQYIVSSSLFEELKDEIAVLNVPLFNTIVENRTSFIRSIIEKHTIYDTRDKKAISMIENLTNEILNIINL